jgi:hypothetical protein
MQFLKRLWAHINKTSLLLALLLPGLVIYTLVRVEDSIGHGDSIFTAVAMVTLIEHWYVTHFLGLDWTYITSGGFFPLAVSLPVLLAVVIINYTILVGLFYLGMRIFVRIRGRVTD